MQQSTLTPCCAPDPSLNDQQNLAVQAFKMLILQVPKSSSSNRHLSVTIPGGTAKLEVLANTGTEGSYILDVTVTEKTGAGSKPS